MTHNKKMSSYGLKIVSYGAPFLSGKLPSEYKKSTFLREFKTKIKNWKDGEICPCRLCKDYLPNLISDTIEAWKFPYSYKNFTHIEINIKKKFTTFYMQYRISGAH